jgi:hypothetical protein
MKLLVILATLIASAQAFATSLSPALVCSDGKPGYDNFVQVTIGISGVQIQLHESLITATSADLKRIGTNLVIVDKLLAASAEGESTTFQTSAVLLPNAAKKTLSMTLVLNGNTIADQRTLKCK